MPKLCSASLKLDASAYLVHYSVPIIKTRLEIALSYVFAVLTVALTLWWAYLMTGDVLAEVFVARYAEAFERVVFTLIGLALSYGSLIYMITRYGRLMRIKDLVHPTHEKLDLHYYTGNIKHPNVSVLIPTYKEELKVIEMTLLSAALQEYPKLSVTLLVDDPADNTKPQPN